MDALSRWMMTFSRYMINTWHVYRSKWTSVGDYQRRLRSSAMRWPSVKDLTISMSHLDAIAVMLLAILGVHARFFYMAQAPQPYLMCRGPQVVVIGLLKDHLSLLLVSKRIPRMVCIILTLPLFLMISLRVKFCTSKMLRHVHLFRSFWWLALP